MFEVILIICIFIYMALFFNIRFNIDRKAHQTEKEKSDLILERLDDIEQKLEVLSAQKAVQIPNVVFSQTKYDIPTQTTIGDNPELRDIIIGYVANKGIKKEWGEDNGGLGRYGSRLSKGIRNVS